MFFDTEDGETVKLNSVIMVEPVQGNNGRGFYNVHLIGGQHVTIKESHKPRADFIAEWKTI